MTEGPSLCLAGFPFGSSSLGWGRGPVGAAECPAWPGLSSGTCPSLQELDVQPQLCIPGEGTQGMLLQNSAACSEGEELAVSFSSFPSSCLCLAAWGAADCVMWMGLIELIPVRNADLLLEHFPSTGCWLRAPAAGRAASSIPPARNLWYNPAFPRDCPHRDSPDFLAWHSRCVSPSHPSWTFLWEQGSVQSQSWIIPLNFPGQTPGIWVFLLTEQIIPHTEQVAPAQEGKGLLENRPAEILPVWCWDLIRAGRCWGRMFVQPDTFCWRDFSSTKQKSSHSCGELPPWPWQMHLRPCSWAQPWKQPLC